MQVTNLVSASQQVPGHVTDPSGGVDQVGGASEVAISARIPSMANWGDLQVAEISYRGEGPGVVES